MVPTGNPFFAPGDHCLSHVGHQRLKMNAFWVSQFEIKFRRYFGVGLWGPGAVKMMFSRERGCKNHAFNGTCLLLLLGAIWGIVGVQNLDKIGKNVPLEATGAPKGDIHKGV